MSSSQTKNAETTPSRKVRWLLLGMVSLALGGAAWYGIVAYRRAVEDHRAAPREEQAAGFLGPPWFRDVTAESGLHFTNRNGEEAEQYTILETLGGGVALLDYDGDGRLDVFVTGGGCFVGSKHDQLQGHPCRLYRNLGGWKFQDVSREAGLQRPWWYTLGAAVADYDRDGWSDLVVTGYGRVALFHNEPDGKGGRRFADVTERVGLHDSSFSTCAGWGDLDGDGYPDLYICHYVDWSFANNPFCPGRKPSIRREVCHPELFKPLRHALFHNDKGKAFHEVTKEQGFQAAGNGLGVILVDINDDGRPDIYVGNDANDNFLFVNRGGMRLEEKGVEAGVARNESGQPDGSMGVDAGDYDGSGRPALWVTNYENQMHALYRNEGHETFYHQSRAAGIAAIGFHLVGFGTGFLDVDNDGWEDLVLTNGHVLRHPALAPQRQRSVLLCNREYRGRRFFEDANSRGGSFFQREVVGRGLAIGDLDNDGWPDLVVSLCNSPVVLLRNEVASAVGPARWLGVRLVGRGHRDVVGSTVILESDQGRLTRFAKGGGSYLSARDPRLLFGLGPSGRPGRLTVKWSWGGSQSWEHLQAGSYWELREGETMPRRIDR